MILVGSFYVEWIWAWAEIGYAPKYGDPFHQQTPLTWLTMLLLMTAVFAPFATVLLAIVDWTISKNRKCSFVRTSAASVVWLAFFAIVWFDPVHVLDWWFD